MCTTEDHITVLTVEKLFKTNFELKCHVHTQTGAKPHSCRHCSERYARRGLGLLKRHLRKSHNEGACFTWHICQKKFSQNGNLKHHMRLDMKM